MRRVVGTAAPLPDQLLKLAKFMLTLRGLHDKRRSGGLGTSEREHHPGIRMAATTRRIAQTNVDRCVIVDGCAARFLSEPFQPLIVYRGECITLRQRF